MERLRFAKVKMLFPALSILVLIGHAPIYRELAPVFPMVAPQTSQIYVISRQNLLSHEGKSVFARSNLSRPETFPRHSVDALGQFPNPLPHDLEWVAVQSLSWFMIDNGSTDGTGSVCA